MPAEDAMLFIDANKFLDLYRTDTGKKLLAPLGEQVEHIFVTQRVVDEVQRNKIQVAADYLTGKFKDLKLQTFNVPDHLAGTKTGQGKEILQQMSEVVKKIKKVNEEVDALALGIVEQISQSEDEVSKALAPIFAKAVLHSQEELQRARDRRELGNPPGKSANPIGDQLTWEQILTHFKGKKRLWILSRDGDYGTVYDGKGFLNRFLYDELSKVASAPEVYLFADTVEGIKHFVDTTGVKAEQRLTPEEMKEVEEEEKALPSFDRPSEATRLMAALMGNLPDPAQHARQMAALLGNLPDPAQYARQMAALMASLYRPTEMSWNQPPAPTNESSKSGQEENIGQIPIPQPSPQEGENEKESGDKKDEQLPPSPKPENEC